jgi:N utilization substance protein A
MREFDIETIGVIVAFENMTGTEVRDCLIGDDYIYFLVNEGKVGMAIGKGGQVIKNAEMMFRKSIKVLEWNPDINIFVKNLVPQAQKIAIKGDQATVSIVAKDRGAVIGKSGQNIKTLRELLERNSALKDLKLL